MNPTPLHVHAREIFLSALRAVDAREATRRAVILNDSLLTVGSSAMDIAARRVYLVAIGKAAQAMTDGLTEVLGERISGGIVCGPTDSGVDRGWARFAGGHPSPNEESIAAARAAVRLLEHAEKNAVIIFLISGGGSAMFELPLNDSISLDDLREANRQLVTCGAAIAEINAVRRAFSAVKGGKLAAVAPQADQITLIVSDTNPGDFTSVASGPSIQINDTADYAREVVRLYGLADSLPPSILKAIEHPTSGERETPTSGLRAHYVLLDNRTALAAAAAEARARGFAVEIASEINEQEIGAGCDLVISRTQTFWTQQGGKSICLISGGEFSCPVRGDGVGGRNLETVLRCALKLSEVQGILATEPWAVLSAGTDGIDGNSAAAGAWADETTIARANRIGLDAKDFLELSDAFHFFEKSGNVIDTGPTGTNVRDVRVVLVGSHTSRPP
jgi:hydroxypyruvate reductase